VATGSAKVPEVAIAIAGATTEHGRPSVSPATLNTGNPPRRDGCVAGVWEE
jgi:hypothetical protein